MRCIVLTPLCLLLAGCFDAPHQEVVVYTAADPDFCIPIFKKFTEETGIVVQPKFDTEAAKTVGLAEAIIAESDQPRCDVFWNNECLLSLRLERRGLLEAYRPVIATMYPAAYRDANGYWHGFAARARVLIVNTKLVEKKDRPTSILALADPKWRGRIGIAEPLFGTTATHAACLFAAWGNARGKDFFLKLKENGIHIMAGNKPVAEAVADGKLAFGLTDTDDAVGQLEQGKPVVIVYPDQEVGGLGTLFIPNTLTIVRGCHNGQAARRLVDYLLSPATEEALATGEGAHIPLNPDVKLPARVETPMTVRSMKVDFEAASEQWDDAMKFLRREFAKPK